MGYASNCSTGSGYGSKSCEASPNYATNYWNESYGSPVEENIQINDSGYVVSANLYN